MSNKVKIVLDADVIIHFAKGELLNILPSILPEYDFVVLDKVVEEIKKPAWTQLQNQIAFLKNIQEIKFGETPEERREFARLTSQLCLGKGESACMAYCRYHHDVVGSSNLRDITNYCKEHQITYLTTIDFLYFAIRKNILTKDEAYDFIDSVNKQESKIPQVDFDRYICTRI
jgi:hypothetical protein